MKDNIPFLVNKRQVIESLGWRQGRTTGLLASRLGGRFAVDNLALQAYSRFSVVFSCELDTRPRTT